MESVTTSESHQHESVTTLEVSVVPSANEVREMTNDNEKNKRTAVQIWSSVRQDVTSLVTQKNEAPGVQRQKEDRQKKKRRSLFASMQMGLQALRISSRHQLILLSLNELERSIASMTWKECPSGELREAVLEMVIATYKATGKQWLGYEPVYERCFERCVLANLGEQIADVCWKGRRGRR